MCEVHTLAVYRVRIPLVSPFRTAYGSDDAIESVFVRMDAGDGFGWGEAQPFRHPTYSPEYSAAVFLTVRDVLAPALVGCQIRSGTELQKKLSSCKGNHFAKGAVDMAWWDFHARHRRAPLWKVLGGHSPIVDVGADFDIMDSIDMLLAHIDQAVAAGFKRVKLKYARGWDLEMVAAVRRAFPRVVLHVDCNAAYTLDDLTMFTQLDRFGLAMIEQPLAYDDLVDHAALQKRIETPICLDESVTSPARARKAVAIGACGWINIKPGRVGGLTPAVEIHDLCQQGGIPCWVGGMLESGLGASHCLALATLPNIKYPSDIFPSSRFFTKDLARPEIVLSGASQVTARAGPGVGAEPDPEQLERWTLEKATVCA